MAIDSASFDVRVCKIRRVLVSWIIWLDWMDVDVDRVLLLRIYILPQEPFVHFSSKLADYLRVVVESLLITFHA